MFHSKMAVRDKEQKLHHVQLGRWARRQELDRTIGDDFPVRYRDSFKAGWDEANQEMQDNSLFRDLANLHIDTPRPGYRG